MIVQNIGRGGKANLTFTVSKDDAKKPKKFSPRFANLLRAAKSL